MGCCDLDGFHGHDGVSATIPPDRFAEPDLAQSTLNCTSVVPVARRIVKDLDGDSPETRLASVLPVIIWEFGEAAGPLLIGPLSEIFGRYPLINTCNILFIMGTVLSALSDSMPLFIVSRMLTGMAVASNVLNPAIIGDMFEPDQRGTAISLMTFALIVGGTTEPAFSGAVAETVGRRFVLWVSVSLAGGCELLSYTYLRETYKIEILRRRVARFLNKEARKPASMIRPASVLSSSGVIAALSLFGVICVRPVLGDLHVAPHHSRRHIWIIADCDRFYLFRQR